MIPIGVLTYEGYTNPVSEPTIQADPITFSGIASTQMTVNWTRGNGSNVIVVARQSNVAANAGIPTDNTNYTANSVFGSGSVLADGATYVIYKGTGTSVLLTGLTSLTYYAIRAIEYNDDGTNFNYKGDGFTTTNPKTQRTSRY